MPQLPLKHSCEQKKDGSISIFLQTGHSMVELFLQPGVQHFDSACIVDMFIMMHQQLQKQYSQLPSHFKQIVPDPCFDPINWMQLSDETVPRCIRAIKTATIISLLQPPQLNIFLESKKPKTPLILVFCQPSEEINISNQEIYPYVPVAYCSWLEAAGAKCLPLAYNLNEGSMQLLLERSNGLIIPGGGSNLYMNYQKKQGYGPVTNGFLKVWRFVMKMWARGVHFPVWGTCLGLELVLITLSNDIKVLSNLNSKGHQTEIYSDYANSSIFQKMSTKMRICFENYKLINFSHMHGISLAKFNANAKLREKLKLISVSKDKNGKWFCSFLEGRGMPLFISQYHPEKQGFQWSLKGDILHSRDSIAISQFIASTFLAECQRCKPEKQFSEGEQELYTVKQYRQIYTPQKLYKVYAIDFKFRELDRQNRKKVVRKSVTLSKKIII